MGTSARTGRKETWALWVAPTQRQLNLQCLAFSRCQGNTVGGHGAAGGRPGTSPSRDEGCAGAHVAPETVTVDIQGAPGPRAGAAAGSRAHGPCTRGVPHAHTCAGLRLGGRIRRNAADTGRSPGLRWGFCANVGWRSARFGDSGEVGCAGLGVLKALSSRDSYSFMCFRR